MPLEQGYKERTPVPGAKDINWYKKDPTKDYIKGDFVTKIRVFKTRTNSDTSSLAADCW